MILSNNPSLSFTLSSSGFPVIISNQPSPLDSSLIMTSETEKIMAKFNTPAKNVTQSAPPLKVPAAEETWDRLEGTQIKRSLFSKFEQCNSNDFYINFQPLTSFPYDRMTTRFVIPEWIPISFRPPFDMVLDDIDAAVAAYIFMTDDENHHGGEILIKTDYGIGDRKTLKTLMPKGWVDQEVLNLLACRLTHIENLLATHATTWFLPTMFAQYALDWVHTPKIVRGYYQHNFMGKVDYVRQIFIPINDQNVHWYLLIVDFHERKLLLLDSSPSPERKDYRRRHIKGVALFLEDMLTDKSFYDQPLQYKHVISEFALVEPIGLHRKRFGSNDCGVWVGHWMIEYVWHDNYDKVFVRRATRMHIALDLVRHPYNELKDKVVERAIQYWSDLEKKEEGTCQDLITVQVVILDFHLKDGGSY